MVFLFLLYACKYIYSITPASRPAFKTEDFERVIEHFNAEGELFDAGALIVAVNAVDGSNGGLHLYAVAGNTQLSKKTRVGSAGRHVGKHVC